MRYFILTLSMMLVTGCAKYPPMVLTATPDGISLQSHRVATTEQDAAVFANSHCQKYGKQANLENHIDRENSNNWYTQIYSCK